MAERSLELKIISAKGLNKVNLVGKMDVYALVYISGAGNQDQKHKTNTDKDGDSNPTWNFPITFKIDESAALQNRLTLVVKIKAEAMFGDKDLGEVHVPIKELLEGDSIGGKPLQFVTYQVRKPSGKPKGELSFSYKFGEKTAGKPNSVEEIVTAYPAGKPNTAEEPLTAYPAGNPNTVEEFVTAYPTVASGSSSLYPPVYPPPISAAPGTYPPPDTASTAPGAYPPPTPDANASTAPGSYPPAGGAIYPPPPAGYPQPKAAYAYQQQPAYGGYGYPPPAGYGGYPPPPAGYGGYPPPPAAYGYPPVQQPQQL